MSIVRSAYELIGKREPSVKLPWRRICRSHAVSAMLWAGLAPASPLPARRASSGVRSSQRPAPAQPRATSSPPCSTCCLEHSAHPFLSGPSAALLSIREWIINSLRTGIVPQTGSCQPKCQSRKPHRSTFTCEH